VFKILNSDTKAYLFIVAFASILFIPFIGNIPLFDWDEINFAECAREMLVSDNYSSVQLYYKPFWEKPPLFIWMQAISMNVFGVNEFAARFPNALCGIITLLVIYRVGKKFYDAKFGLIWCFVYASTLLPHLFFKSGIIDPWFNLFIFSSVYYLIQHTNNPVGVFGVKTALFSGFFLGLALLTKGPAALILVGLTFTVFLVLVKFKKVSSIKYVALFFVAFLITGLSWFTIEYLKGNGQIVKEFIDYQIRLFKTEDSDHGGPFIYHFIVLLIGCFPSSLFFILSFKSSQNDTPFQLHIKKWMMSLFWVVLIIFSIVQTKIVHYSSLCYFPLTFLATYSIHKLLIGEYQWKKSFHVFFIVLSTLLGFVFILLGSIYIFIPWLIQANLIADVFAVENLKAKVSWFGFEWVIGLVFLAMVHFALSQIKQGKRSYIYLIFVSSLFAISSIIIFIVPKVEQYTQRTAIEFYKACASKNYYVETIGFKSYASLFYGELSMESMQDEDYLAYLKKRTPEIEAEGKNAFLYNALLFSNWLEFDKIKRPACFAAKITEVENVKKYYPELKELYRQNGFVFYVRFPR
jgi:4-amino-4-deoxy-L-arabinose transferase-like glycosyltransferase